ncbi:MAG: DNA repair protein RecO [bacterium]
MSLLPQPVVFTDAFVLRTWSTGETSVVVSLLTAEHGYQRAIAKAARRPASVLRPLVQPGRLTRVEISLIPDRELQYLRGGSVVLDSLARTACLETSVFLLAVVELVDRCRPSGAREGDLFALCHRYVRMLSSSPSGNEAYQFYAFESALLDLQGVAPVLNDCSNCGKQLFPGAETGLWFSPASGGVVCGPCAGNGAANTGRMLDATVWQAMRDLSRGAATSGDERPRWVTRELGILLHHFLGYHLPGYRLPASLELLRPLPETTRERPGADPESRSGGDD